MSREAVHLGTGHHRFRLHTGWARLPQGERFGIVSAAAVDPAGRLFVYARGPRPVTVFGPDGAFLGSWGEDLILDAHGIFIDRQGWVYLTDRDAHQVLKCDGEGRVQMRIGERGQARWQAPFNHPAGVAVAADGEIFVADGYANARVHRFAADGTLLGGWGEPGDAPGAFRTPHDLWVSPQSDRVYVCDRDNHRVQVFDRQGGHLATWTDFFRPMGVTMDEDGFVYVSDQVSRVGIFDEDGRLVTRLRVQMDGGHAVWVDGQGDLYVAEIHVGRVDRYERVG